MEALPKHDVRELPTHDMFYHSGPRRTFEIRLEAVANVKRFNRFCVRVCDLGLVGLCSRVGKSAGQVTSVDVSATNLDLALCAIRDFPVQGAEAEQTV